MIIHTNIGLIDTQNNLFVYLTVTDTKTIYNYYKDKEIMKNHEHKKK